MPIKGHHVALDPYQCRYWSDIGRARERVLGTEPGIFEYSSEDSVQGLARFGWERRRFGTILIDGNHRFDDVLIDSSSASLVCEPSGHFLLDDMWMPSIQRVVSFICPNRHDFIEVCNPVQSIAVFEMTDADNRQWDHFVPF